MRSIKLIMISIAGLLLLGACEQPTQAIKRAPRNGSADQNSGSAFSWNGLSDKSDSSWDFE